jgi:CMP-N,N'-diacetyllegionaminic acid synthase
MNEKVLGILPARGGSKGIVGKNLHKLAGKPLLAWAGEALLNAKSLSKCICSTDSDEIAISAKHVGLEVPFIRPENLSGDTAKIVDVILHALNFFSDLGFGFSHVALVQATSPTVRSKDIDEAVKIAMREDADTVFSGYKATSSHPSLMYSIEPNQQVSWLLKEGFHEKRRQEFKDIYIRSGLIYVIKTEVLFQKNSIYGDKLHSYEIEENRAITIDEEQDLEWAEFLFKNYE